MFNKSTILEGVRSRAIPLDFIQPKPLRINAKLQVLRVAQLAEGPQTCASSVSAPSVPSSSAAKADVRAILNPSFVSKAKAALLGLALGDAYGGPFEFMNRRDVEKMFLESPQELDNLQQGGAHRLNVGEFTDDSQMALCLGESLLERGEHDSKDQLNKYVSWYKEGRNIPRRGVSGAFDIGVSTRARLTQYQKSKNVKNVDPKSGGNGSLMRLAPTAIFYATAKGFSLGEAAYYAAESSETTHGSPVATECCKILSFILNQCFEGKITDKKALLASVLARFPLEGYDEDGALKDMRLLHQTFANLEHPSRPPFAASGYCLFSLREALWCFATTDNFSDAIKEAVKLGFDTDTVAAIVGQIAGAYYGEEALPLHWLAELKWKDHFREMACQLAIRKR